MGIRIHKVMGYGLTNVVCREDEIIDPRFNPNGYLRTGWEVREEKWTFEKFKKWLADKKPQIPKEHIYEFNWMTQDVDKCIEQKKDFYEYLIHGTEYLMPRVFCILPICHPNWRRFDDDIDYVEVCIKNKGSANSVKKVNRPIYPYINYWDNRTGRKIDFSFASEAQRRMFNKEPLSDKLLEILEFNNKEECRKYLKPIVPSQILYLLEYCEVFTDIKTFYQLEPIIYTYWS